MLSRAIRRADLICHDDSHHLHALLFQCMSNCAAGVLHPPAHSAKCMGSPDIDILNFFFLTFFFILNERHMLVIMHIIYFELLKCMKVYTTPPHTNASTQCCAFLMADSVRLNCKIEQEVATTCDAKQSSALGRALKWDAWVPTFKTISYSAQLFFFFFFVHLYARSFMS